MNNGISMNNFDNNFKYCPKCGWTNITNHENRKWKCECWFELYNNVAAATWIIIKDNQNNVLFEVREKDPKKWFLSLPWWFVEPDEDLETWAIRECEEEIWLKITDIKYLCSYPNTYIYNNIEYSTCDIYFLANIWNNLIKNIVENLDFQKSEVNKVVYHKIETIDDVDNLPIAFESAKYALKYLLNHN